MKQFFNVLSFELTNYFKSKSYVLSTIIISLLLIIIVSLPSFIDFSGLLPNSATYIEEGNNEDAEDQNENTSNFALVDENNIIPDIEFLNSFFNSNFDKVDNEYSLNSLVENNEVEAGFIVNSLNDFTYVISDSSLHDSNSYIFEEALLMLNRISYATANNINIEELEAVYNTIIESETNILGKDSAGNYGYTYILTFSLYMIILMYGQLIATSVASEKSNRAIEVLVTSANTTSLIVGKVLAASIAGFVQVGAIVTSAVLSYSVNKDAWGGILDNVLAIPADILLAFAAFGGFGYIFYSFIFGALGALVSKTEDISSSISSITMIFVIVFFISMFSINTGTESLIVQIASFIPFSSCMVMFIRIAMGTVTALEIGISFIILATSTVLIAILASKIYRMGTLRYGNPIKLKNAFKAIKKES